MLASCWGSLCLAFHPFIQSNSLRDWNTVNQELPGYFLTRLYGNAHHFISFSTVCSHVSFCICCPWSLHYPPPPLPEEVWAVKCVFLFHTSFSISHLCFLESRLQFSVCSTRWECDCSFEEERLFLSPLLRVEVQFFLSWLAKAIVFVQLKLYLKADSK